MSSRGRDLPIENRGGLEPDVGAEPWGKTVCAGTITLSCWWMLHSPARL